MFQTVRDLTDAVRALAGAVLSTPKSGDTDPRIAALEARLSTLESSVAITVAEAQAQLNSAIAERKVARNAENRTIALATAVEDLGQDLIGDRSVGEISIEERHRQLQDVDAEANGIDMRTLHEGMEVPRRLTRSEQAYRRMNRS